MYSYAPTEDKDDTEIELFYIHLDIVLQPTKKEDITIAMEDFNAKVGIGKVDGCVTEDFVIKKKMFQVPDRRLYTWRSSANTKAQKPDRLYINQK